MYDLFLIVHQLFALIFALGAIAYAVDSSAERRRRWILLIRAGGLFTVFAGFGVAGSGGVDLGEPWIFGTILLWLAATAAAEIGRVRERGELRVLSLLFVAATLYLMVVRPG